MAKQFDFIILGNGLRGTWLAVQLVKLGWKVGYCQIPLQKEGNKQQAVSPLDDWPFQIGIKNSEREEKYGYEEFIETVFKPDVQNIAFQIMTDEGPCELAGGQDAFALKKFFGPAAPEIEDLFKFSKTNKTLSLSDKRKILVSRAKALFDFPLGYRWCLEWLGSLKSNRDINTLDWLTKYRGVLQNPKSAIYLCSGSLAEIEERALVWAEAKGVTVRRNAKIVDIGVKGSKVTGIEFLGGDGFIEAKNILMVHSLDLLEKYLPKFSKNFKNPINDDNRNWVWLQSVFKLKPHSKPAGLLPFSSFVMDPYLPLTQENMGILKWQEGDSFDTLAVWVKVPYKELRRKSYSVNLTQLVQANLAKMFPRFSKDLTAVLSFEEALGSNEILIDYFPVVFSPTVDPNRIQNRFSNFWVIGPQCDQNFELKSCLDTENKLLKQLKIKREKELARDRKIQPPRNDRSVGASKQV